MCKTSSIKWMVKDINIRVEEEKCMAKVGRLTPI